MRIDIVPADFDARYFQTMRDDPLSMLAQNWSIIGGHIFGNLFDRNHGGIEWARAGEWQGLRPGKIVWRAIHGELYDERVGIDSPGKSRRSPLDDLV